MSGLWRKAMDRTSMLKKTAVYCPLLPWSITGFIAEFENWGDQ
jgi:hypothetical protein